MPKFINPLVNMIHDPSITKRIEIAGRTCYKSGDKIKEGSDIKFCQQMIKSGHDAMIEFGTVIIKVSKMMYDEIYQSNFNYLNFSDYNDNYLISGNVRAWRDFIKKGNCDSILREYILFKFISENNINFLFSDIEWNHGVNISDVKCFVDIVSDESLTKEEKKHHKYYHFLIETDRGVMAELTRHRPASFAIQSTRYVNYKDGVEFIKPFWYDDKFNSIIDKIDHHFKKSFWKIACRQSEKSYKKMVSFGSKPQEARAVLNNSTKTVINISANLEEFEWIFKLRCAKAAHPDIQIIANRMKELVDMDLNKNSYFSKG